MAKLNEIANESGRSGKRDFRQRALVIAGDTLTRIEASSKMKESFLLVSDHMSVVIACRVSPKQKGDLV